MHVRVISPRRTYIEEEIALSPPPMSLAHVETQRSLEREVVRNDALES